MEWIGWDSNPDLAIVDSKIIIELTTVYSVVRVVCGLAPLLVKVVVVPWWRGCGCLWFIFAYYIIN